MEANTNHMGLELEVRTLNFNLEILIFKHYQSINHIIER